ncbi:MAG TPA: D-alanyl-D-alanine carboxypeptidase/D-alanyl-D-alanine-endopeptidase [Gemmatimonas sp.]|uniref:D-alanyl-D-alanine carboxypeptidase/D-alanyl-D-alanine endopeptidase n=1 Tax=Gemmatimonas sp. TaxID=1962908 RepID=UPI002ED7EC14
MSVVDRKRWSSVGILAASVAAGVMACARPSVPAPVGPHRPEPVAPEMIPVMLPMATIAMPGTRDTLQYLVDSVLAAPMWRNARWGILLVDAERNDTILSHDADRLFMPASNQKLLTGAIALQRLGPDFRWRTPVLLDGVQRGAVFHGNVLVQGSGDPSISDALRGGRAASAFDGVLDALQARGIKRITGRVLPWGDALPGATTGFGWAWDDFDFGYSAAIDELTYNEGELYLHVKAGAKVGQKVQVKRAPTERYPALRIDAVTRDSIAGAPMRAPEPLSVAYDSIGHQVVVSGTMPLGDSTRITVAYRHPGDAFIAALGDALHGRKIAVQGTVIRRDTRQGSRQVVTAPDTLYVIESVPFADVLRRMQKPSQNQIAELLFRTSGYVTSGDGSADSARAVGIRTLAEWGITGQDVAYRDGSGLSRHDYLTPRAVVRVLDAMHRSPWYTMFRDALPVAGVDGTIANRMKDTPAQGNVHAKTGTLDKARSLSGYVTSSDGRLLFFSLLCNNFSVPTREVERVQDLLVRTMAGGRFPALPQ